MGSRGSGSASYRLATGKRPSAAGPASRTLAVKAQGSLADTASPDGPDADLTGKAAKAAPPWLVSLVVHLVLVLVLGLLTVRPLASRQVQLQAVYTQAGEQLLDERLDRLESLKFEPESPLLSFDTIVADDPLAAPPKFADAFLQPNRASDTLAAPNIGLALSGREAGMKKALLLAYGGNAATESAVEAGLQWLKRNQMRDGGWSLTGPYRDHASIENRVAATAMALLAFQGAGHTHLQGDFQKEVERGWSFLLKLQDPDGLFQPKETGNQQLMYGQAQATIAICELFGMTKDERYRRPAQLALEFAHKSQSSQGGWRYQPREDSDLSVTGWFVMAFQSGRMAGLEVQSPALERVSEFLDACAEPEHRGARYAYRPGEAPRLSITAEALLCRQYLGWRHDDQRLRRGVDYLLGNPINYQQQNVYYWYYATQVCHHMDGEDWNRWNAVMREELPAAQIKSGSERGSWPPHNDQWGSSGGRLYTTCLSIYMLEVYYRHLPIYRWRLK